MVYMFDINSTGKTSQIESFDFPWTPGAKATCLQESGERFRPRSSPDAQNRAFAKNGSWIQVLHTTLKTKLPFKINFWATVNEKGVFRM